ncbi:hypothetical protein HID58_042895 [Brassica napus]|uniref:Uncharacterized protein n=1 Tax=Brassica napus TaxID=3708 RepID=A0ABQ8BEX8_BRANA|nr:hypothetical protein HID58_042895 [Brassica napus]
MSVFLGHHRNIDRVENGTKNETLRQLFRTGYAIEGRQRFGLAEMNDQKEGGGAGFNFQVGREVKTIREDCPPGKAFLGAFSKQRRKGGQKVPRALCPTHLFRSKCSSQVPPNAPISRQRLCEFAIDPVPVLFRFTRFISPIPREGRGGKGFLHPSLCPADHSAGILHSRLRLTTARGCSCRYVSQRGSLAPPVLSFYDMLLLSPYSICHLVISASLRASTFERNGGLHSVTPRSPSERSE